MSNSSKQVHRIEQVLFLTGGKVYQVVLLGSAVLIIILKLVLHNDITNCVRLQNLMAIIKFCSLTQIIISI